MKGALDFLKDVKYNNDTGMVYQFQQIDDELIVVLVYSPEGELKAATDINWWED